MKRLRLSITGFGTVGQGLAELLSTKRDLLQQEYNLDITLVSVANARSGFIYRKDGLDIPALLELAAARRPLTAHPGITHRESALEGLQATGGDILVEATPTNLHDAEPGMSHIRIAISQGMHVVAANKGPGALAANELFALAQQHGVQLRMDSTGDVEGHDAVTKTLILAALIFGRSLKPGDVIRQGITTITREQVQQAIEQDKRIKLVASLRLLAGDERKEEALEARVEPIALPLSDPLARVDGVMNALTIATDTLSEVTIIGPGAGRVATGQGLLADVIACACERV